MSYDGDLDKNNDEELEKLEIDLLLQGIYRHHGFDFKNYSYSFLRRRIYNRISAENLNSISGLQEKILHEPGYLDKILNDFSIAVTEMFRDPDFFRVFREKVVPIIRDYPFIRIWHAGCSTGEEVYSMAILLHEEGLYQKTRIYATDMHEHILGKAKRAVFPLGKMQAYTKNYLTAGGTQEFSEYYMVTGDKGVAFAPFLSENIVFAPHNLVTDQSINEFHIIICRNVLIYFNRLLQDRVFNLFHQSLSPGGFLGLGAKEDIKYTAWNTYYEKFAPNEKIFRKNL